MSEETYKCYDYAVVEVLSKDSTRVPTIHLKGKIMARSDEEAKVRVNRLTDMVAHEPQDVEVKVNCPFC